MTMLVFSMATSEWDSRPDLTTIESVTRPVEELVFPAVTVCPSREVPLDPMAPVTKFLNNLKFQCGTYSTMEVDNCNQTEELKGRFGFLIDFAFDLIDRRVDEIFDGGMESEVIPRKLLANLEKQAVKMDYILSTNTTTYRELKEEVKWTFGRNLSQTHFRALWGRHEVPEDLLTRNLSSSLPGRKLAALATFALRNWGSFGIFLSDVLPLFSVDFFSQGREDRVRIPELGCSEEIISGEVRQAHRFLSEVTRALGTNGRAGNATDRVWGWPSLFDLPQLVALPTMQALFAARPVHIPVHSVCERFGGEAIYWPDLTGGCARRFEKYLYEGESHPGSLPEEEGAFCRDLRMAADVDLETVMAIMRQAKHRGRGLEDLGRHVELSEKLSYPHFELGQGLSRRDRVRLPMGYDPFAAIPVCDYVQYSNIGTKFGYREVPTCLDFQPTVTDRGICHSFNALPVDKLFKPSAFVSSLKRVYMDDFSPGEELSKAVPYSEDLGLTFYLDHQTFLRNYWNGSGHVSKGTFKISIADQLSSMSTRNRERTARAGYHTEFLLTPTVLTSGDLRDMEVEERNCMFPHEGGSDLKLASRYSQEACVFECMVEFSRSVCNCTPWDFPSSDGDGDGRAMCNAYEYYCFDEAMKNTTHKTGVCRCLPDCEVAEYLVTEKASPIDVLEECNLRAVVYLLHLNKFAIFV